MTKEDFKALGLDDKLAEICANASKNELAGYIAKNEYDIVKQSQATLEKQAKEHAKQITELKKSVGDADKLNKTIEDLQAKNKQAKMDYMNELTTLRTDYAIKDALTTAKARNVTAVKALIDMGALELDDAGTLKGLDKQLEKLKADEATSFLFEQDNTPTPGKGKPNAGIKPGANNGGDDNGGDGANGGLSIGAQMAQAYNSTVAPAGNGEKG